MRAVQRMVDQGMSLNGALRTCEVSKQRWYWRKKTRVSRTDANLLEMILDIRERRPFYGTRRVAAELARRLGRPVNRKRIRRAYRLAGWSKPAPSQGRCQGPLEADRGGPGPTMSGRPTSRTCGAGRPTGGATASTYWTSSPGGGLPTGSTPWPPPSVAVDSLVEAVATAKPDCSRLTIQCDNGSQYAGKTVPKGRVPSWHQAQVHLEKHAPAERPHRVVPRHPQARVHLAARFLQLPADRGSHIRSVP